MNEEQIQFKALGAGLFNFIKRETVMSVALVLALVSSIVLRPSFFELADDIDWRSLGILMSLMMAIAGFRRLGLFEKIAAVLLGMVRDTRGLVTVLVMLCFFLSMAFTNDVALITFVPFALYILSKTGHKELMIKTVSLQTVAANMGSMLTPVGNPQNLYLFSEYRFSVGGFLKTMAPYTAIAFVAILALLWVIPKATLDSTGSAETNHGINKPTEKVDEVRSENNGSPDASKFCSSKFCSGKFTSDDFSAADFSDNRLAFNVKGIVFGAIFVLSLLAVGKVIPWQIVLCIAIILVFVTDYRVVGDVDYALLGTFIFFFIFIGNIGSIPEISSWLFNMIKGHEVIIGALSSQILSNVPATLLLSNFTGNGSALLVGVNLGGLGTLIASMASLISYKFLANQYGEYKTKYLLWFSAINFGLLAVLLEVANLSF